MGYLKDQYIWYACIVEQMTEKIKGTISRCFAQCQLYKYKLTIRCYYKRLSSQESSRVPRISIKHTQAFDILAKKNTIFRAAGHSIIMTKTDG